jgi:hypothetical protein
MLHTPEPNKANIVTPPKVKAKGKKKAAAKAKPDAPTISEKCAEQISHLIPLPVQGPDRQLYARYNDYLCEYRKYLIDAQGINEADVTISDAIAREIVEMPAHTAEGMLLKLNLAAAVVGETKTEFPWGGKDFEWDDRDHCSTDQIEYVLIDKLRDDIRRMQRPATNARVSPDLAALLRIWKPLDDAANEAMKKAEVDPPVEYLTAEMNRAIQAEKNIRFAILNTRARSLADISAKFSIVSPYADLEDWPAMVEENKTGTDGMLWSICGDLLELPGPIDLETSPADCPVAKIADQFRYTIDKFTSVEEQDFPRDRSIEKKRLLEQLRDREQFLQTAASHNRASSIKSALFQIAIATCQVDQAINSSAWREAFDLDENVPLKLPREIERLEADIYRLLWSSAKAIAQIYGVAEKEYAADYFLNIDPFKEIEA